MNPTADKTATHESGDYHVVEVWVFSIEEPDAVTDKLRETLSDDELARAARFIDSSHQRRFISGRGRMRQILASYCGCQPAELVFQSTPAGKPLLRAPQPGLNFNLSHSGSRAALGVCRTAPLGIDIEAVRQVTDGLARRFFAAAEVAELEALAAEHQQQAFFRCWTRKEAFLKATGEGIARGLDSFQVSLDPDEPARIKSVDGDAEAGRAWTLVDFDPGSGMFGAIALRVATARLKLRRLEELTG
jgi:4'-phosphopantetheinyl transferase